MKPGLRQVFAILTACVLLVVSSVPAQAQTGPDVNRLSMNTSSIMVHVQALAGEIGARPAGSPAETQAAAYIATQLRAWGYSVYEQEFTAVAGMQPIVSRNVVAYHPGASATLQDALIIGAHYDSVTTGTGATDNASGIAVMLAVAEALVDHAVTRPVVFVAFGAEEVGKIGSDYFVAQMAESGIASLYAMINVDTVGAGDYLYAYAGTLTAAHEYTEPYTPGPTWARDQMLALGDELGIAVRTSPANSWNGFTGTWSDHAAFTMRGVPIVYLERWNWDAGSDRNWGQETAAGDILHTARDTAANVDPAKMLPVADLLGAFVLASATLPGL